eukprot:CAMPEP_0202364576 /NCGR_PEP_ID=MMETSP1126-20121109/15935_1 /ASSEMBLY_ACC=CAM_ASM_000457 /TAXON_ID=3047 /ORGANISM="Dunaliella tertiolecta, Strain CCMP1320" /LENGTH=224 /DNA_ID=CAMNT_0048959259 /DNA_START=134 /DNA_END=810 /DNA_ORIENTATION=+
MCVDQAPRKRRPDEEIEGSVADGLGGSGAQKEPNVRAWVWPQGLTYSNVCGTAAVEERSGSCSPTFGVWTLELQKGRMCGYCWEKKRWKPELRKDEVPTTETVHPISSATAVEEQKPQPKKEAVWLQARTLLLQSIKDAWRLSDKKVCVGGSTGGPQQVIVLESLAEMKLKYWDDERVSRGCHSAHHLSLAVALVQAAQAWGLQTPQSKQLKSMGPADSLVEEV